MDITYTSFLAGKDWLEKVVMMVIVMVMMVAGKVWLEQVVMSV